MSSRRPPAALVCGVMAMSAGAQVVAGFTTEPTPWQVIGGLVTMLAAGVAAWWSTSDSKKIAARIVG